MPSPAHPSPADSARLFVALWPGDGERRAIAGWQSQWQWPVTARTVPAEKLHLTLHFLGQVPVERVPALAAALRDVPTRPTRSRWGRVQDWDGIAVLRPLEISDSLAALHTACGEAVRAAGLAVEDRRWRAHITLARKARGATPPPAGFELDWAQDGHFVLVHSVGQGGGYRVLERFPPAA